MFNNLPKKEIVEFLGSGVVLVIEPTSNYRNSLKRFLTNLKVTNVKMVTNVADARRELLTSRVSMFICEWAQPGSNGIQFCRELRKEVAYKTTPFLLLSVENLKKDVILATEVQIDGYLLKPFSFEDFCDQVVSIMHNHTKPSRINTLIQLAEERLERGDLDGAEKIFNEVVKINSGSARALCGIAKIQDSRGNTSKAKNLYKEAALINPDYIESFKQLLAIAERLGDLPDILEAAMFLHSISPENPKYVLTIATAHLRLNSLEQAEQYFKKTVALSPMIASAYKGLGNLYMVKNEYDKAMKNYSKALDLDKDDISILNSYGMALVRLEKYEAGIQKYQVALRIDPHNYQILFNVGQAFEKQCNFERAKHYYIKAQKNSENFKKAAEAILRVEQNIRGNKKPA